MIVNVVLTILSLLAGGAVTFLASSLFYRKASEDLRQEAESLREETRELRHYSGMIMRLLQAMSGGHSFHIVWDSETGKPKSVVYHVTITARATGAASVDTDQEASDEGREDR